MSEWLWGIFLERPASSCNVLMYGQGSRTAPLMHYEHRQALGLVTWRTGPDISKAVSRRKTLIYAVLNAMSCSNEDRRRPSEDDLRDAIARVYDVSLPILQNGMTDLCLC